MGLSLAATAFGLVWLVSFSARSLGRVWRARRFVFTETTPPPGASGGLLNAIVGSLIHDGARASLIGTPIGILAGTYLAEYGRYGRLATSCASSTTSCCPRPRSSSACSSTR